MYTTVSRSLKSCKSICTRLRQLTTLPSSFMTFLQCLPMILVTSSARILHSTETSIPIQLRVPAMKVLSFHSPAFSGKHGLLHTITNAGCISSPASRYRESSECVGDGAQLSPQESENHGLLKGFVCQQGFAVPNIHFVRQI